MPDAAARALGRKVAFHRVQRGLSQRDFGSMIDRSETWVSQVERGVRRIDRMTVLRRVADVLDVPLNELAADTPAVMAVVKSAEPAHLLRMLLSSSIALGIVVSPRRGAALSVLGHEVDKAWELAHSAGFAELVPLLVQPCQHLRCRACRGPSPPTGLVPQGSGPAATTQLAGSLLNASNSADMVVPPTIFCLEIKEGILLNGIHSMRSDSN